MTKLKCSFGVPRHGWLPVVVSIDDFLLEMDVSDVPVNPVDRLIGSLARIWHGYESEVWWHLEPASYYFQFTPVRENIEFSVWYATEDRPESGREKLISFRSSRDKIVLPFWRAIKSFATYEYNEPSWPTVDSTALEKLTRLVRSRN